MAVGGYGGQVLIFDFSKESSIHTLEVSRDNTLQTTTPPPPLTLVMCPDYFVKGSTWHCMLLSDVLRGLSKDLYILVRCSQGFVKGPLYPCKMFSRVCQSIYCRCPNFQSHNVYDQNAMQILAVITWFQSFSTVLRYLYVNLGAEQTQVGAHHRSPTPVLTEYSSGRTFLL